MRRLISRYSILLVFCVLTGCNDFLEETSQSEVRPSTVEELYQVMLGEAYPRMTSLNGDIIMPYLELLTDNMQFNDVVSGNEAVLNLVEKFRPIFSWKKEMYEECALVNGMGTWDLYYSRICGCNVVLDYLDRVSGDVEKKYDMRGQVLVLRGWWFLQLVNLYGLPYNEGDPAKNPGVPLKLSMEVTGELFPRNSVAEVYGQIEKDLLEGTALLKKYGTETSAWKMSYLAGMSLLSRMYLYMENWDKAIVYADSVLEVRSGLCDFSKFDDVENAVSGNIDKTYSGVYNSSVSNEIIWMYGNSKENTLYTSMTAGSLDPALYAISDELVDCFEKLNNPGNDSKVDAGDLRRCYEIVSGYYYDSQRVKHYYPYWVTKQGRANGIYSYSCSAKGLRTAELYLNRAEAYIQKYRREGSAGFRERALTDLNRLRESRFDTRHVAYVPVESRTDIDVSTADKLYDFCLLERRRELMFEDHRWFDLRRTGMPRLEHKVGSPATTYVLEVGSPHYVLPIPEAVMKDNARLEQNKY